MDGTLGPGGRGRTWLRRHGWPLGLFLLLSGLWMIVSWRRGVEHCTSDLFIYFGMVLKAENSATFPRDLLFGDPANYAEWPLYTAYLRFFSQLTGDLTFGLKALTFPLNLLFMVGAYVVFLELTRIRWAATLLAALAALPIGIPASAEMFGIGPATLLVPRTIFTAVFPFVWWGYLRGLILDDSRLLEVVFLAVGLLANIHGISAFLLTQILLLLTLFHLGFSPRGIRRCLRLGLIAALGALPLGLMFLRRPRVPLETGPVEALLEIFQWRNPYLYPQAVLLSHMPSAVLHAATILLLVLIPLAIFLYKKRGADRLGIWLFGLAVLAVWYMAYSARTLAPLVWLSAVFLLGHRRPLGQTEGITIQFGLATFLVGVGGVLILQGLYLGFGIPPFAALHQFRAIRFSGFVLFALAAMGVAWLSATWGEMGAPRRAAVLLIAVMAVGMTVRDVYRTYVWNRRDAARDDLVDVAAWARANTSGDALFLMDSPLFRILARRSLVATTKDLGILFMVRRNILEAYRRIREQQAAADDVPALVRLAARYGADYVVVGPRASPTGGGQTVAYRNTHYIVLACRAGGCG